MASDLQAKSAFLSCAQCHKHGIKITSDQFLLSFITAQTLTIGSTLVPSSPFWIIFSPFFLSFFFLHRYCLWRTYFSCITNKQGNKQSSSILHILFHFFQERRNQLLSSTCLFFVILMNLWQFLISSCNPIRFTRGFVDEAARARNSESSHGIYLLSNHWCPTALSHPICHHDTAVLPSLITEQCEEKRRLHCSPLPSRY